MKEKMPRKFKLTLNRERLRNVSAAGARNCTQLDFMSCEATSVKLSLCLQCH